MNPYSQPKKLRGELQPPTNKLLPKKKRMTASERRIFKRLSFLRKDEPNARSEV